MKGLPPLCFHLLLLLPPFMAAGTVLDEERATYLVLMDGEPVAFRQAVDPLKEHKQLQIQRKHAKQLVESHDQLLQSTLDMAAYRKLYSFHHILDGFAIHTTLSQAKKLESAPGVQKIEKDRGAKLMTTYTPHFLGLPERVWNQKRGAKHAGEGILVGVIDTGIDPGHPSFAYEPSLIQNWTQSNAGFPGSLACQVGPRFPEGSCNGKIVSARFFADGAAASLPLNASRDFSPFDNVGHGSHVASIAAGNWGVPVVVDGLMYGFASGMAPSARQALAVYKALYPAGGTVADIVAAIDQAALDGVDVLVLSIGPDEPPESGISFMNIFDIALLFARKAGIFVAQAAGNKGPGEATVVSFSPWSMGVAASTTGRSYTSTIVTGDAHRLRGIGLSTPTAGNGFFQFKLISARDAALQSSSVAAATSYAEECQHPDALKPELVINSIVICSFSQGFLNGASTVTAILATAKALHFVGFILLANPSFGDFIAQPLPLSVPGIMIPRVADAEILMAYYEKHTCRNNRGEAISYSATAAIVEGRVATFSDHAPVVSRFSSRGPDIIDSERNPADVLKPDIVAPGEQIWAAWSSVSVSDPILSGNSFALISGTSMATPHVAGVAALIKQWHPSWTPSMIASSISTTATRHDHSGLAIMSQGQGLYSLRPSTPFDHGAGVVNPSAALDPGLVFSAEFEDYVRFLCSLPNVSASLVQSAIGMKCNASSGSPADLNLPSITISALRGHQTVKRNVKNVAGKPETYLSSIRTPEGVEVSVHPEWFDISPEAVQDLEIKFNVTQTSDTFDFGEIVFTGSLDHIVRMPLAILPVALR
ncbi:subtilisin-like protease SBT2.4 [Canna indica]|uniref:Subtilisin-like protease SBT2.4 n=1 Tax=Canna indica TaxID=4628 RepID=A0AAQ3KJX5_9LILI|nr:subtilisin-like protease SBT2.4 [Canna indica]